ncbi:hypothetical protein LCGC14_0381890 [marine sediment metagenome]|uniref:Uncharacterized protein n=1 Tax=marine sediment metagenome TaxID=412755 RepID=A0A0F9TKF0_9ZZZZ
MTSRFAQRFPERAFPDLTSQAEAVLDVLSISSLSSLNNVFEEAEFENPDKMFAGMAELRDKGLARVHRDENGTFWQLTKAGHNLKRHRNDIKD